MKKGRLLQICPTCQRRRACWRESAGDFWAWTCSQDHAWSTEKPILQKLTEIMKTTLIPHIKEAFSRDNAFYTVLKRR